MVPGSLLRSVRKSKVCLCALFFLLSAQTPLQLFAEPVRGRNLALLITGLSGSHQFQGYFSDSVEKISEVLRVNGYPDEAIYRFSETPGTRANDFVSDKEHLEQKLKELAASGDYENVFIWIAGHANGRDEESLIHLPKQDVSYKELMGWIEPLSAKRMILALAIPQGQAWIQRFGKPGRIIAAGSGLREYDFIPWMFLRLFPAMFQATAGEMQPGSLSVGTSFKDVFVESQKRSQAWYRDNHLQPTELAYLDADGDAKGETLFDPETLTEPSDPILEIPKVLPASRDRGSLKAKAVDLSALNKAVEADVLKVREKKAALPAEGKTGTLLATAERQVVVNKGLKLEALPDAQEAAKVIFLISGGSKHGS